MTMMKGIHMEHILISPGKIKLIMTRSDVEHYELDTAVIGETENVCRESLKSLFCDLGEIIGFDTRDEKLFIQLYPSKDGGAELYITKLGEKNEKPSLGEITLTRVVSFLKLSSMLEACKRLSDNGRFEMSSAWHGDGAYYLMWEEKMEYREYLNGGRLERLLSCIGDDGHHIKDSAARFYLMECCECFCRRDAVAVLSALC